MANTTVGTAYIQIMPSTQGIKGSISDILAGESKSAGEKSGGIIGSGLGKTILKTVAALGIGKMIANTISTSFQEGAKLQQSIGGIETLFKDSAGRVEQYASQAWKTVGVSANEYMEQTTSFAAALVSSLGGDTQAAADLANTAMVDMGDNANKMGTDLSTVQQTYQSIARGNYAMLDNLKLGYGGTKSEMERLMADAEKLTGEHYTVGDFADTVKAIHAVQESLGISGTTAQEASTTWTGSINAVKASWTDLLGSLTTGGDVTTAIQNLVTSVTTFLVNNAGPMIGAFASTLIQNAPLLLSAVMQILRSVLTAITDQLGITNNPVVQFILNNLPAVTGIVIAALVGVKVAIIALTIAQAAANVAFLPIVGIIAAIVAAIAAIILIITHWNQITQTAGQVWSTVWGGIKAVFSSVVGGIKTGIQTCWSFVKNIFNGIRGTLGSIGSTIVSGFSSAVSFIRNLPSEALGWGRDMIQGFINGIKRMAGKLIDGVKNIASNIRSFLHFSVPDVGPLSDADEYGPDFINLLADGMKSNIPALKDAAGDVASALDGSITAHADVEPIGAIAGGNQTTVSNGDVTINVYGAEGQDVEELADEVSKRISDRSERRGVVYA